MAVLIATAALCQGCASNPGPRRFEPLHIPSRDAEPRVIVYGDLLRLASRREPVSIVEWLFVGPSRRRAAYLHNPQGLAQLGDDLLVCDQGGDGLVAVDPATGRRRNWGDRAHRPRCPVDVESHQDRVYVADTTLRSVLIYDARGPWLGELIPTTDPKHNFRPCALLVHDATLYVGDLGARCVQRWSLTDEQWLSPWTPPQGLLSPTGLGVTPDGVILIVDAVAGQVLRVTEGGEWLSPIGRPGRGPGEFVRPKQVAVTACGAIWVTDAGRQSVLVFDADGTALFEMHESPPNWSGFTLPMGALTLNADELPAMRDGIASHALPPADEFVIVTDSMGATSLTLLGLVRVKPTERTP